MARNKLSKFFFILVSLFLQNIVIQQDSFASARLSESRHEGIVHWVIDGDTFELETGERVRLIGIDTPENMPWKNRVDFFGPEASEFSKKLLSRQKVWLEYDIDKKDRYGRTLAYVFLSDGEFVNELLAREGFARVKRYGANERRYKQLKAAEAEAKKLKKGLWAFEVPEPKKRVSNLARLQTKL